MLWLAAYLTGFPPVGLHALRWTHGLAPMWSGLYLISTWFLVSGIWFVRFCVNALSGLYLISTILKFSHLLTSVAMCQCPLGLIPHFYAYWCCNIWSFKVCVNALSGLYLISTVPLQKPRFYAVSRACFCRYLSEYSDNSSFACMLTFWTYLMRCTYPWHWIKYSTNYNRCHPIFSLSW